MSTTPRARDLPQALRSTAVAISERVRSAGARAWIVGGPVRDLALGKAPMDLDMACALPPDRIEALFERTTAVGKAFGTVVIHGVGVDVQMTTFRRERGFSDARRPDRVDYTDRLEEDARRRDFTCNAMYLDALDDSLEDPTDGRSDLAARRLRAVGDPAARFAEDGLRLVRMARFAASLDFEVESMTLHAARASAAALVGVSPERRLGEFERFLAAPRRARALRLLDETELLPALLPEFASVRGDAAEMSARLNAIERLPYVDSASRDTALGLATLLRAARGSAAREAATRALAFLRPSRELRERVQRLWDLADESAELERASRATWLRFARRDEAADALRLAAAWNEAHGLSSDALRARERALQALQPAELFPTPLLRADDLERAGLPRGPRWRECLEAVETEQLEGRLTSRDAALAWLASRR